MAQLAGTVGPQFVQAGTSNVPVRLDAYGAMVTSGLRGNYAELASRGQVFTSYVATVATSLAATATIGNMIWNPPGSGVRLELLRWVSQIVATSATDYRHCDCRRLPDHDPDINHGSDGDRLHAHYGDRSFREQGARLQHRDCPHGAGHPSAAAPQHGGNRDDRRRH
jgi:hypothetical protein